MQSVTVGNNRSWLCSLYYALIACIAAVATTTLGFSPIQARELVSLAGEAPIGTIIVNTSERQLYYVLGNGMALRYDVAVGKEGMQWAGETFVQSKTRNPGWTPTPRMRREDPIVFRPMWRRAHAIRSAYRAIYLGWSRIPDSRHQRSSARSAGPRPAAASECGTAMSLICSSASISARPFTSSDNGETGPQGLWGRMRQRTIWR